MERQIERDRCKRERQKCREMRESAKEVRETGFELKFKMSDRKGKGDERGELEKDFRTETES